MFIYKSLPYSEIVKKKTKSLKTKAFVTTFMSSSEEEKAIAADGMIGAIPVNPKLSEVLEINSEADDFRKLREEAEEQFNLDKLKEKYRKKLLASKEFRGDKTLTETDIDLAVQIIWINFTNSNQWMM